MEDHAQAASRSLEQIEKGFFSFLTSTELPHAGDEEKLAKYRDASQNLIFADLDLSLGEDVEGRLWAAHGRLNNKFRKWLQGIPQTQYNRSVERRKAERLYVAFIKSSIRFYRGFIQHIASHFRGIPEILSVARKLGMDTVSVDPRVVIDAEQKNKLLKTCHACLIHLGDLSRYRETETRHKERNWGPARGYYDLAMTLNPASGQSFNQLSVIAREDNDHLRALYYMYRSLATPQPHLGAPKNLEKEFHTIQKLFMVKQPLFPREVADIVGEVGTSFLKFHVLACENADFQVWKDEQFALVDGLSDKIKAQNCYRVLKKICLINIAAPYCAAKREREAQDSCRHTRAVTKLQSLNIATFTMLLHLLTDELKASMAGEATTVPELHESVNRVSPILCRILPCLRLYTAWLLSSIKFLLQMNENDYFPIGALERMWLAFCDALSLVFRAFPVPELPKVLYLLEEDQDTRNFEPFSLAAEGLLYKQENGVMKPIRASSSLPDSDRPQREMLFRIKELVRVGVHLYEHKDEFGPIKVPIRFGENHFVFDKVPVQGHIEHANGSPDYQPCKVTDKTPSHSHDDAALSGAVAGSPQSGSSHPPSRTFTAQDLVHQMQKSSPANLQGSPAQISRQQITLPGILPTPLTPLPGEVPGSDPSSRPGTGYRPTFQNTPTAPSSSALFQQKIAEDRQEIHARSSPFISSMPTSSEYNTPTGFNTFFANQMQTDLKTVSPSWNSIMRSSLPETEIPREVPQPARYGAIGGERPKTAKTPTSWQAS